MKRGQNNLRLVAAAALVALLTVAPAGVAHAGWYTVNQNHKALFHFDEGSGLSTAVASGDPAMTSTTACLGNVASPCPTTTPASAPTWTSDSRYGSALSFDGTDDVVSQPAVAALNWTNSSGNTNTDDISIAAWIKPSNPIQSGTILAKGGAGSQNYQFGIVAADSVSANLRFSYLDSGLGQVRTITTPLGTGSGGRVRAGVWSLVAVHYSRKYDAVEFFINGGRVDAAYRPTTVCSRKHSGQPNCQPTPDTSAVTIGAFGGANFFRGIIDDVFLFIATNPTPNATGFLMASDGGVVIDRMVYNGGTMPDSVDLYRKNFGDGAPAINLGGAILADANNNEYTVPSVGTRCQGGTTDCYLVAPGGRVTITFDGNPPAGTHLDTATNWYTSNGASTDTLGGTGLPTPTTQAAALELRTTGLPNDPDSIRALLLTDAVSWGCAGCSGAPTGGSFFSAVAEGLWPGATTFVTVGPTDSSIHLITPGENSNGAASWARG